MDTQTTVWINGHLKDRIYFGNIKPDDSILFHVQVPADFRAIPTNEPGITTDSIAGGVRNSVLDLSLPHRVYGIVLTGQKLYEGHNVLVRFVERMGKGKVRLHTIGMIRFRGCWQFMKTVTEIQFYSNSGKADLFTPSLINQKELVNTLETIAKEDKNIPNIAIYFASRAKFEPQPNTVLWFDPFRLIGAIHTEEGDVFFHMNNIGVKTARFNLTLSDDVDDVALWKPVFPKPGQKVHFELSSEEPVEDEVENSEEPDTADNLLDIVRELKKEKPAARKTFSRKAELVAW